jgi:hypothetical protein
MTTIYVKLLDEETDTWRPVEAEAVGEGSFRIVGPAEPRHEDWQFKPGEIVRCEVERRSGKECLVAVARLSSEAEEIDPLDALETALAEYLAELCLSADRTSHADDRSLYQAHLAEAARMFKALRHDDSVSELEEIVARERRSYGWSHLGGEEGRRAEAAFESFAALVERSTSS